MSERPTTERLAEAQGRVREAARETDRALNALLLESPAEVVKDVRAKVEALQAAQQGREDALAAELLAVTERERALAEALERLVEVVEDFLTSEYPNGTDHPADAEAARLSRAFSQAKDALIAGPNAALAAHGDTPEPALPPCGCRANDWVEGDNGAVRCVQCGGYAGEPGTSIRVVGAAEATEETT